MATVASQPESVRVRVRDRVTVHLADSLSYWLIIGGVYLTYGFLFYYSAKEKLFDDSGTMPAPLAKAFHGSLIASFPGVNTAWLLLGVLEFVVFLTIVASVAAREFLPSRGKPVLLASLGLSMFTFGLMAFAENMIADFSTVAELFAYFTGTGIVIVLVLLMPPYRPAAWLSSPTRR
jgi:hypothetical protein